MFIHSCIPVPGDTYSEHTEVSTCNSIQWF